MTCGRCHARDSYVRYSADDTLAEKSGAFPMQDTPPIP